MIKKFMIFMFKLQVKMKDILKKKQMINKIIVGILALVLFLSMGQGIISFAAEYGKIMFHRFCSFRLYLNIFRSSRLHERGQP